MRRQKTRPLALLLSLGLVLGLTGCGSMLERSYASVTPHTQFSDESDSGSVLRAETYQGLVSALLHLVEQGAEKGELRLYQYSSVTGAAASDVDQACLEVTQEDPLGAYAVDYIKYDVEQMVSYYQINVKLAYNIDPKELKDVISVTGSTAVRQELEELHNSKGITEEQYKYSLENNNQMYVTDRRTNVVLLAMYEGGFITHEQYEAALNERVNIKEKSASTELYDMPYFVEYGIRPVR